MPAARPDFRARRLTGVLGRCVPGLLSMMVGLCGCAASMKQSPPHHSLWNDVRTLCGRSYAGKVIEAPASDTVFAGRELIMHVRECGDSVIRIPFHVGDNRSRTWVLTRTALGLRLKHDHRHEDGAEDTVTQYGGDARLPAEPGRVEFPADTFTAALLPAARTNVWTVEMLPGRSFVYALRREGTDRRYRIEFDLTRPVTNPPPPWGAK